MDIRPETIVELPTGYDVTFCSAQQAIANRATAAFIGLVGVARASKKTLDFQEYAVLRSMENALAWVIDSPEGRSARVDACLDMAMEDGNRYLQESVAAGGSTG